MSYTSLVLMAATFLVILVFLVIVGLKAQKRPRLTGYEGLAGETGVVKRHVGFRGRHVMEVRGELWWCRSETQLSPGQEVRVISHDPDDPVLIVEPVNRKGS